MLQALDIFKRITSFIKIVDWIKAVFVNFAGANITPYKK